MYLIPLAAVALASCSNESTDSREQRTATNPGTALNIFPAVQGTTRGTITTDANFTSFIVKASADANFWYVDQGAAAPDPSNASSYKVLGTGFTATVTKTNNKWQIQPTDPVVNDPENPIKDYYWSSKSMTSSFTAWAPTTFNPENDYTVEKEIGDQEDIVYAYNSGAASTFTSGVPMNFQHALSQVVIKALNKDNTYEIKVAGVKLNNIKNKGLFNMGDVATATTSGVFTWPADVWTLRSSYDTYLVGANDAVVTTAEAAFPPITLSSAAKQLTSQPFILMPQTTAKADLTQQTVSGAYFSILVQVRYKSGEKQGKMKYPTMDTDDEAQGYYAYVAVPVDIDWKPGYKYTYTLNFSKDGIGKVDPKYPDNKPTPLNGYPTADVEEGEDILDGAVPLYFTVTVEDWTDAFETIDM